MKTEVKVIIFAGLSFFNLYFLSLPPAHSVAIADNPPAPIEESPDFIMDQTGNHLDNDSHFIDEWEKGENRTLSTASGSEI